MVIQDEPRFAYRGFMFDISRDYFSLTFLKKLIFALSQAKINVLHIHMSDDDSLPIQLPSYPGNVKFTAFSEKESYSKQDLAEITSYATSVGVSVVPEFDVPGHASSYGKIPGLEDLMSCPDIVSPYIMEDGFKIHGGPQSQALNPTKPETYEFISKLTDDILELFPDSPFYHYGGDEVIRRCWTENPQI